MTELQKLRRKSAACWVGGGIYCLLKGHNLDNRQVFVMEELVFSDIETEGTRLSDLLFLLVAGAVSTRLLVWQRGWGRIFSTIFIANCNAAKALQYC